MKFIADISDHSWIFEKTDSTNKCFYISFKDGTKKVVNFNNLSFGIIVKENNNNIVEQNFPNNGQKYLYTDQDILTWFELKEIRLGKQYNIKVWAKNDEVLWEDSFDFIMPLPYKSYESFIWNEDLENWLAPIPYPNNGKFYEWNEEVKDWIEYSY